MSPQKQMFIYIVKFGTRCFLAIFIHLKPYVQDHGTCANYIDQTAEVTQNCGLIRASLPNPLNSGLGFHSSLPRNGTCAIGPPRNNWWSNYQRSLLQLSWRSASSWMAAWRKQLWLLGPRSCKCNGKCSFRRGPGDELWIFFGGTWLGRGFKYFLFPPLLGDMIQFD